MKYELTMLDRFAFYTNVTSLFNNIRTLSQNIHLHSLLEFQQSRQVVIQVDTGLSRGSCRSLKTSKESGSMIIQVLVTPAFVTHDQMDV